MASGHGDTILEPVPEPVRFRPSTKRKAYRRRVDDDDGHDQPPSPSTDEHTQRRPRRVQAADMMDEDMDEDEDEDDAEHRDETMTLAALRARASRKARLRGVGFRSGGGVIDTGGRGGQTAGSLVPFARAMNDEDDDEEANPLLSMQSRFTHQTGIMNDVDDRHIVPSLQPKTPAQRPG